jgi:hypothetical protein
MLQHAVFTLMEFHLLYMSMHQRITRTTCTVLGAQPEPVKLALL